MTRQTLSRRALLSGLLAGAATAPLSTSSSTVRAGSEPSPLRFFLMFTGNGQAPSHWLPTGSETSFTLSPVLEPLAPFQGKLLLSHGLSGAGGHAGGMSETTTGRHSPDDSGVPSGGPSIDQLFAEAWRGRTALASLELGVVPANDPYDQTCYSPSGMPLPAIGSPYGAFQRIAGVTNVSPEEAARRRAKRQSVLDSVSGEIEAIRNRLGADSRALLDEHLTLVREQEKALANPSAPVSCQLPEIAADGGLAATWKAQHDNVITAFRCDVTRVATLRAGGWGGIESGGYDEIGISKGHHSVAHSGPDDALIEINRFHAEQLAYLLGELDAVDEGDGTLLDNTVVVWVNELGLGPFNHHSRDDVHVVMAGGKNAGLRNGAFVNLGGTDYQHFLFTLAHLLGETGVESFGDHGDQIIEPLFA